MNIILGGREMKIINGLVFDLERGFIARELGKRVDIRRIPTLKFTLDDSIEYAVHISEIINQLNSERKKDNTQDDE